MLRNGDFGRSLTWLLAVVLALVLLGPFAPVLAETAGQTGQRRLALVVGNANYDNIAKLTNAEAEAHAVAKELGEHGFEVIEGYNLGRRALLEIVSRFADRLPDVDVAVFYFSGQGAQQRGRNFLLPTGIKVENLDDLAGSAVPVTSIAMRMVSMNRQAFDLLIINASRDDPFPPGGSAGLRQPGLSAPEADGVMVLQAAGANQVALDRLGADDHDPSGVFTRELLKSMREPGVPVRQMASRLRMAVQHDAASVGREQDPMVFDAANGDFTFTPTLLSPPQAAAAVSATSPPPSLEEPDAALNPEKRKRIVAQLQQLGFYDGVGGGLFGPAVLTAIKQFQSFQGEAETGVVSAADRDALAGQSASLVALLAVADRSPRGVAASAIPGGGERQRHAARLAGGHPADFAEAAYWYALSALQGNRLALLALGSLKLRGEGISAPDRNAAQLLWRAAAARGEPTAFYHLGNLAEQAIPPDRAAALRWYRRAAQLHVAAASQSLKRLE